MPALVTWSADIGPLGVRIFLVISGFVICRLVLAEELRYGSVSLTGFYYRLVPRILPPLYLFLLSLFLMGVARWITVDIMALVMEALFLTNTRFAPNNWFSGHAWSRRWKRWRGPFLGLWFLLLAARDMESVYRGWHAHVVANSRNGFSCICAGVLMAIWEARARKLVVGVPAWVVLVLGMTILVDPLRDAVLVNGLFHSLAEPLAIGLVLCSTQHAERCMAAAVSVQSGDPNGGDNLVRNLSLAGAVYRTGREPSQGRGRAGLPAFAVCGGSGIVTVCGEASDAGGQIDVAEDAPENAGPGRRQGA